VFRGWNVPERVSNWIKAEAIFTLLLVIVGAIAIGFAADASYNTNQTAINSNKINSQIAMIENQTVAIEKAQLELNEELYNHTAIDVYLTNSSFLNGNSYSLLPSDPKDLLSVNGTIEVSFSALSSFPCSIDVTVNNPNNLNSNNTSGLNVTVLNESTLSQILNQTNIYESHDFAIPINVHYYTFGSLYSMIGPREAGYLAQVNQTFTVPQFSLTLQPQLIGLSGQTLYLGKPFIVPISVMFTSPP